MLFLYASVALMREMGRCTCTLYIHTVYAKLFSKMQWNVRCLKQLNTPPVTRLKQLINFVIKMSVHCDIILATAQFNANLTFEINE